MIANVKIAIGGGINEPRDALLTILYGLLTNPDQLDAVRADGKWRAAFEEGVRWVAPIQASSRLVMEDTELRGCFIPKGDTVMTIQASANRDEDVFEDGENYNALREPNSPGLWQRPASLRGRAPVAANGRRHPDADAVRALPQHDLA
jgi:cytochrome P450